MPPQCRSTCCSSQPRVPVLPLSVSRWARAAVAGSAYLCDVCLACPQDRAQFVRRHLAARRRVAIPPRERVEGVLDAIDDSGAATFEPLQQLAQRRVCTCPARLGPGLAARPALRVEPLDVAHEQVAMQVGQSRERTRLAGKSVEGLDMEPMRMDAALGLDPDVAPEGLGQSEAHVLGQAQRGEVDDGVAHPPWCVVTHGLHPLGCSGRGLARQHPRHRLTACAHGHCVPDNKVSRTSLSAQASTAMARRYRSVVSMRS